MEKEKANIKLEIFEGPLDLLLNLITKEEVDIFDIPIVKITEQYMQYLYKLNELDIEVAGEFIVMAASLLEIKSKMMLPKTEEENEIEDPREELARRLAEYKVYKLISEYIKSNEPRYNCIISKEPEYYPELKDAYTQFDISSKMLLDAFSILIKKNELRMDKAFIYDIENDEVSTESKIEEILLLLNEKEKISFFSLVNNDLRKTNITALFLAILELLKKNMIALTQQRIYEDIIITKAE